MNDTLASHFLPTGMSEYFLVKEVIELIDEKTTEPYIEIHLEEKNTILDIENPSNYESKGFTSITIQDFPLRGKPVYLVIRKRLWRSKIDSKVTVKNSFPFIADGSRLTKELADFLKDTGR